LVGALNSCLDKAWAERGIKINSAELVTAPTPSDLVLRRRADASSCPGRLLYQHAPIPRAAGCLQLVNDFSEQSRRNRQVVQRMLRSAELLPYLRECARSFMAPLRLRRCSSSRSRPSSSAPCAFIGQASILPWQRQSPARSACRAWPAAAVPERSVCKQDRQSHQKHQCIALRVIHIAYALLLEVASRPRKPRLTGQSPSKRP
jgi:hypothetical protein